MLPWPDRIASGSRPSRAFQRRLALLGDGVVEADDAVFLDLHADARLDAGLPARGGTAKIGRNKAAHYPRLDRPQASMSGAMRRGIASPLLVACCSAACGHERSARPAIARPRRRPRPGPLTAARRSGRRQRRADARASAWSARPTATAATRPRAASTAAGWSTTSIRDMPTCACRAARATLPTGRAADRPRPAGRRRPGVLRQRRRRSATSASMSAKAASCTRPAPAARSAWTSWTALTGATTTAARTRTSLKRRARHG